LADAVSPRVTIVLPVYYEQELIATTLEAIETSLRHPFSTLVVYDVEEDPTVAVVKDGAAGWPHARLAKNIRGRGVLGAIKTGLEATETEYAVVFMADLSDDPKVINMMVDKADEGFDVVAASRYMRGGAQLGGPRLKTFLSRSAGKSLHLLTGVPTHDATNAFRLYRKSFVDTVQIQSTGGFEVTMELTIKAYLSGRPIAEVPTTWRDRTAGTSKFNFRRWLPQYIRWYLYALPRAPFRKR
jgi:glycosyltransferase involved in cell wall biosynthesis